MDPASAAQNSISSSPLLLPVAPGSDLERSSLHHLLGTARAMGLPARLLGHPGPLRPYADEVLHSLMGFVALAFAPVLPILTLALLLIALSGAALRSVGQRGLAVLWPRFSSWSLLPRPIPARPRCLLAAPLDRVRPLPWLRHAVSGALMVALVGWTFDVQLVMIPLAVLGLLSSAAGRSARALPEGPEVTAAQALLTLAKDAPEDVGVVLTGGGAEEGWGLSAVLDWRSVGSVEIVWVANRAEAASAALQAQGHQVVVVPVPASPGPLVSVLRERLTRPAGPIQGAQLRREEG